MNKNAELPPNVSKCSQPVKCTKPYIGHMNVYVFRETYDVTEFLEKR